MRTLVLPKNRYLVADTKSGDERLLEIRAVILAVAFGNLEWRRVDFIRPIIPEDIHGRRVEMHIPVG